MSLLGWFRDRREWRQAHNQAWREWVIPSANGLTKFQVACEVRLRDDARLLGTELPRASTQGTNETYLTIEFAVAKAKAYIYEDGASLAGEDLDLRWERWDYASPEALIRDFVDASRPLLSG